MFSHSARLSSTALSENRNWKFFPEIYENKLLTATLPALG
jgi:hypothetical protein